MYKVPGTGIGVGTGVGALAVTGADVTWWIVAGIVLLLAGAFLMHSTRRKRLPAAVAVPVKTRPNRAG
ncbi:LPXTG cell wall anchor domain-containing protein [Lentzea sp. NPDC054927]